MKYKHIPCVNFKLSLENKKLVALGDYLSLKRGKKVIVGGINTLPGYDCSAAYDCFSANDMETRKIIVSNHTLYNCFGAATMAYSKGAFECAKHNSYLYHDLTTDQLTEAYDQALDYLDILRIHAIGGDFKTKEHIGALATALDNHPSKEVFGYTKQLPLLPYAGRIQLQFSEGGKYKIYPTQDTVDDIPTTFVVTPEFWTIDEPGGWATSKLLSLGYIKIPLQRYKWDDYGFITNRRSFGILIHGTQTLRAKAQLTRAAGRWNG